MRGGLIGTHGREGLDWHPGLCVSGGWGSGGRKGPSSAMSGPVLRPRGGWGPGGRQQGAVGLRAHVSGQDVYATAQSLTGQAGPWRMAVRNGLGPRWCTPLVPVFLLCPALPTCPPFTGLVTSIHQGTASTRCTWRPGVASVGDRVKGTQAVPSETSQRPTEVLTAHTLQGAGRSPG